MMGGGGAQPAPSAATRGSNRAPPPSTPTSRSGRRSDRDVRLRPLRGALARLEHTRLHRRRQLRALGALEHLTQRAASVRDPLAGEAVPVAALLEHAELQAEVAELA